MEELLRSGNYPSKILATQKWINKNNELYQKIDKALITVVSEDALASSLSTKNPDGVLE